MPWLSWLAYYFILWWLVLFAMLPFSVRTHGEDDDVVLGTVASAPKGGHVRRAMLRTTIVAAIIFAILAFLTQGLGFSVDDIPRIVPDFENRAG